MPQHQEPMEPRSSSSVPFWTRFGNCFGYPVCSQFLDLLLVCRWVMQVLLWGYYKVPIGNGLHRFSLVVALLQ
eukprot:2875603-Amphidinium_carterae.1